MMLKHGFVPMPPIQERFESVEECCKLLEKVVIDISHAKSDGIETSKLRIQLNSILAEMKHLDQPQQSIKRERGSWNLLPNRN